MTTKRVTSEEMNRIVARLVVKLERHEGLEDTYARAVLEQAQGVASGKPTPQARMAAEGMGVRNGTILSLSGGPSAEVAVGSEFGSTIYRQFGPRRQRGYWLLPSAESPNEGTIQAGEDWLDETVEAAIRGI